MYPDSSELGGYTLAIEILHETLDVLLHFAAGSVDALKLTRWTKLALAVGFLTSLTYGYVESVLHPWSNTNFCVEKMCLRPLHMYRSAKLTEILFTLKVLTNLMLGYPYAVLTALFVHPHSTPRKLTSIRLWLDGLLCKTRYTAWAVPEKHRGSRMVRGTLPGSCTFPGRSCVMTRLSTVKSGVKHENFVIGKESPADDDEPTAAHHTKKKCSAEAELVGTLPSLQPTTASKNRFAEVLEAKLWVQSDLSRS